MGEEKEKHDAWITRAFKSFAALTRSKEHRKIMDDYYKDDNNKEPNHE